MVAILFKAVNTTEATEHLNVHPERPIFTHGTPCVPNTLLVNQKYIINSPFWRMVLDSLGGEKRQEILHCPPHEGIGREEAADVREHGFIQRASAVCVVTYRSHVGDYAAAERLPTAPAAEVTVAKSLHTDKSHHHGSSESFTASLQNLVTSYSSPTILIISYDNLSQS